MKKLGTPTTLGQLRMLLELHPDETLLQFRNQPVQELIEVDGAICFQETNRWDNIVIWGIDKPMNRLQEMEESIPWAVISGIGGDFSRACSILHENIKEYPRVIIINETRPLMAHVGEFKIPKDHFKNMELVMKKAAEEMKSLALEMKNPDFKENQKRKGHERPYKFHR